MLRLFSVILVCVGSMCLCAMAEGGNKGKAGEYGVKLCGREFIRAVIFTCGGSRWKRLSLDVDRSQNVNNPIMGGSFNDYSKDNDDFGKLRSILQGEPLKKADLPYGQGSMKELFNLYDDYSDYEPMSNDFNEYVRQVAEATRKQQVAPSDSGSARVASPGTPWIKSPRKKRDLSMGVAGMCCKWGCTKAEISTLC
ncbi:Relaxin-3 [Acipenser ruthenus]|uniref:Relaxin-3 n=1 Tax=Acipenser ruthenus TaxID=7906 RepID=A0A662YUJ9_ACIRT|nr:relaxin-3-like [Acipenser ruthenus]RXM99653.1 Relaxin-3 [Acipenser ruthenus]